MTKFCSACSCAISLKSTSGLCRYCYLKKAKKEYRDRNKEKIAKQKRDYYERTREVRINYSNSWNKSHKDHHLKSCNKWIKLNKEKRRAQLRKAWMLWKYQIPQIVLIQYALWNEYKLLIERGAYD